MEMVDMASRPVAEPQIEREFDEYGFTITSSIDEASDFRNHNYKYALKRM